MTNKEATHPGEDKALKSLKRVLTNEQYEGYVKIGGFRHLGKRYDYLLRKGEAIEVVDKDSLSPIGTLCVIPDFQGPGELPPTDVVTHQILWLKNDETTVWRKGNFIPYS